MAEIPNITKQEDALQVVQGVFSDLKGQRVPFDSNWLKWYKQYKSISHKKYYQGRANLFVPETFDNIETRVADIMKYIMPVPEFFALKPRQREDVEQAELNTELILYQLERARFKTQIIRIIRQGAIYGTMVLCMPWERRIEPRMIKEYYNEPQVNIFQQIIGYLRKMKENERDKTIFEGPTFEVVPLQDFYINPRKSIDTATELIRTQNITFDQLKSLEKQGIYFNVDRCKEEDYTDTSRQDNLASTTGLTNKPIGEKIKRVELVHYWGLYKLKNRLEPCIITTANNQYTIRMEPNPFYCKRPPYFGTQFVPVEDEFYGMGIAELIESLQIEINDTRNQIMDSKTFNLLRMWKRKKGAGITSTQLQARPNGIIDVENMEDLMEIQSNTTAEMSGYNAERVIKEDIRRMAGTTASGQGMPAKFKTSATEVRAMQSGGDVKNSLLAEWLEETLIKPIIERIYDYNQEFISDEQVWSILGPNRSPRFFRIKPEQIGRMYDVIPLGSSISESRAVQQQQLINFSNIAFRTPPNVAKINYEEILKRIWEGFGFRNSSEIMMATKPEEMMMTILEEMVKTGMQPQQAFRQLQQLVGATIGKAMSQMQQGAQGETGGGGGGTPPIGASPQEQPQPLNQIDAERSATTIRGI